MLGNFDDLQKAGKTGVEATTKALDALSKSTQAIVSEMADYSKRSFETNTKTLEKLCGVRSLDKAIEVQSEYAKSIIEDFSVQMTKLGQLYADLAKETFKPFGAQLTKPTLPR
jgi:hypothetical protein